MENYRENSPFHFGWLFSVPMFMFITKKGKMQKEETLSTIFSYFHRRMSELASKFSLFSRRMLFIAPWLSLYLVDNIWERKAEVFLPLKLWNGILRNHVTIYLHFPRINRKSCQTKVVSNDEKERERGNWWLWLIKEPQEPYNWLTQFIISARSSLPTNSIPGQPPVGKIETNEKILSNKIKTFQFVQLACWFHLLRLFY